ncbi:MAG: NRDE family protein, partial [Sandaracinus sp.]|nr:NRDE family protein [Sandaracinus sp.]
SGAWWSSNRGGVPTRLVAGVHGVSNALLDTPWPKVVRAKEALAAATAGGLDEEALFAILADERPASDATLPDTGVGLALERALSPIRIAMTGYGTRASTVLVVRDGKVRVVERSIAPTTGEVRLEAPFDAAF